MTRTGFFVPFVIETLIDCGTGITGGLMNPRDSLLSLLKSSTVASVSLGSPAAVVVASFLRAVL